MLYFLAVDRILSDAELKDAWQKAAELGPYGLVIRLCILLGTRKGETSAIRKEWITSDLAVPAEATKNGRMHVLPLTNAAKHHAEQLASGPRTVWNSWNKLRKQSGFADWTIHDLRRTFATRHAQLGTPPHIIERLLNHITRTEISPLAQIYNRYKYLPEMREALVAYEAHLETVIGEPLAPPYSGHLTKSE